MAPRATATTAAAAARGLRALAPLLAAAAAGATTLSLRLLPASQFPEAVCNDGTQSGYYVKLSETGSNTWIVHQEGGGWCYDSVSCKKRSPDQRSSKKWAAIYDAAGLFDATDPRFAEANLVYVGYCSSDAYAGNGTVSDFGFSFAGRAIVRAVFDDLMAEQGLGAKAGTQVMYGGCSAGARGALFNADDVSAQLTAALGAKLTRFGALLDSMFYVEIEPFDASLPSLMYITEQATLMTGAVSRMMPACAAAYPAAADAWKCFFGSYALPYLQSDYLMNSFLYDSYQLDKNGATGTPKGKQVAYDEDFRNLTQTFAHLDVTGAGNAAVLPACHKHCNTLTGSTWSTLTVDGHSLEASVASWFFKDASVPVFLEETCAGYNCGQCGKGAAELPAPAVSLRGAAGAAMAAAAAPPAVAAAAADTARPQLVGAARPVAAAGWNDTFASFDESIWTQQTDIEHCNDGACFAARVDHLSYGAAGIRLDLNQVPCNETKTGCCVGKACAQWASGHIATAASNLYGTYTIRLQPAHSPDGGLPPTNSFSCWTPTYVGSPHNEIAVCFSGLKGTGTEIHYSYWYDATAHTSIAQLPFKWSEAMHTYGVRWAPDAIDFLVDGEITHSVSGKAGSTIPYTAGYSALILRPKDTK